MGKASHSGLRANGRLVSGAWTEPQIVHVSWSDRDLPSSLGFVETLQELMGGELKLFMLPLRGSKVTCDQAHPMHATEVTIDEPVPGLRVVVRSVGQAEMPFPVLVPRMRLQEGVFVIGAGLTVPPVTVENVLMGVDEASGSCYRALVERIRSHQIILSRADAPSDRRGRPLSADCAAIS